MLTRRDVLLSGGAAALAGGVGVAQAATSEPFAADWQSLAAGYRHPEWFRDAKLGIRAHWGPQCQPEFGDWYARLMYMQGRPDWMKGESPYEHHLRSYGHPSRTGFIDIIGQWKAESWQPEHILKRYVKAG